MSISSSGTTSISYRLRLVTSRASAYRIQTVLDRDYAFDGFALSLPLQAVPRSIRSALGRESTALAQFERDPTLDHWFLKRPMSIAHLTTTLFESYLALDVAAVTALLQGPVIALFPLFRRLKDGDVLDPQRLVELARPVPVRSLIGNSNTDTDQMIGTVAFFDGIAVRIDRFANDMTAAQIPGRRCRQTGLVRPPLAIHWTIEPSSARTGRNNSNNRGKFNSDDQIRSPLYIDIDASMAMPFKSDVVQYLFALLTLLPSVKQMIGLRHILDTLRIPNPDQDLDLYRRALQAPFSTLHDTSIRIPDRDSRLRLSGLPLISSLSSDWVQAADNDHDRFDSDFFSLSRISLLGNAVLSFLIGSHLVVALPAAAEGVLTRMRAAILCQSYLAPVAVSLDLGSAYLRPVAAEDPSPKTLTELLSALFGVLYRCQGIEACRRVLARVLFRHDPDAADLRQYWDGVHPQSMIDQIIADCQSFRWDGLESIQMLTGGPWQHPELITAALTHQSSGGQHQQRLEYLGDAVLQLLVTDQLLDLFPDATEGELSQLRTSLVQNDTLVDVAKHLHLSEWIAHGISRPDRKIFADAVEALLGALYLDRHLGVCRQLISDVILTTKSIASARNRSNAKSQLQQLLSAKSGQNPNYIQVPKTTTPSSKSASSNWVEVQIYHQQNVLATGRGRSLKQAESNAAQNALHLMDTNAVVVPSNSRARSRRKRN